MNRSKQYVPFSSFERRTHAQHPGSAERKLPHVCALLGLGHVYSSHQILNTFYRCCCSSAAAADLGRSTHPHGSRLFALNISWQTLFGANIRRAAFLSECFDCTESNRTASAVRIERFSIFNSMYLNRLRSCELGLETLVTTNSRLEQFKLHIARGNRFRYLAFHLLSRN